MPKWPPQEENRTFRETQATSKQTLAAFTFRTCVYFWPGRIAKLVVFVRSQIHSYAYHLVSVRGHNQRVRSPIQGFPRCEGISFIPPQYQRSTSPRLSPQEQQHYITSPLPASTPPAQTGARCPTLRAKKQIPHRVCKHGAESMHTCSKRHLLPGQRSADDIAVRADGNLVRQLALRW